MSKAFRHDIIPLGETQITPQGYLKADAYATKVGVFLYRLPNGSVRKELRPPDEVFDYKSLNSLAEVPITNDHPPAMLDAENTKKYAVGFTGANIERDSIYAKARITVTDSMTIKQITEGGKRQLSCGYTCELDEAPGEWQGEKYDAVQRDILYNHLAVVNRGRAGPEVRVWIDKMDGEMVEDGDDHGDAEWTAAFVNNLPDAAFAYIEPGGEKDEEGKTVPRSLRHFPHHNASVKSGSEHGSVDKPHLRNALARLPQSQFEDKARPHLERHAKALGMGKYKEEKQDGGGVMVKIKLDGIEYEVSEGLAKSVMDKVSALEEAEKTIERMTKEADELKGRADGLEADLKKKDEEIEKVKAEKPSRDDTMKAARARMDLEDYAKEVLGEEEAEKANLDGIEDIEIKKLVIAKVDPELKLDEASEEYVNGCFSAIRRADAKHDKAEDLENELRGGAGKAATQDNERTARTRSMKRDQDAWKAGLPEHEETKKAS